MTWCDSPRLGHLTELPAPLRWPLASRFSEDRRSLWLLSDGLVACAGCGTMRAVFQITRHHGQVQARCLRCAGQGNHEADASSTTHAVES